MRITNPNEIPTLRAAIKEIENAIREFETNEQEVPGYNEWAKRKAEALHNSLKRPLPDKNYSFRATTAVDLDNFQAVTGSNEIKQGFAVSTEFDASGNSKETVRPMSGYAPTEDEFVAALLRQLEGKPIEGVEVRWVQDGHQMGETLTINSLEEARRVAHQFYAKASQIEAKQAARAAAKAKRILREALLDQHDPDWTWSTETLVNALGLLGQVDLDFRRQGSFTICDLDIAGNKYIGVAKCAVEDEFDTDLGRKLALRRALDFALSTK